MQTVLIVSSLRDNMKIHLRESGLLFCRVYLNFFSFSYFALMNFFSLAAINCLMLKIGLEEWTSTRPERNDRKSSHRKL